ncbi:MAG: hypothetical protein V7607_5000 [Solirubrobacteraceae bacterium]
MRRDDPGAAVCCRTQTIVAEMSSGETWTAEVTVRCTQTALWARAELEVDGLPRFSRVWDEPLVRTTTRA